MAEYFAIRIWASPATLFVYAVSGVLFGLGRTREVLVLQLVLNLANAALNLWFVVGLELGVPGVALGTLIAQWLAAAVGVVMLARLPGAAEIRATLVNARTWRPRGFKPLIVINGFIFIRTVLLMTVLTQIMRESAPFGEVGMAATHVATQFMLLISLGLDGFAHAAEALAGAAWGHGRRAVFRRWVLLTGIWAGVAAVIYALGFWLAGDWITALLTNLTDVRAAVTTLMPIIIALPLVSVWCYHFDGVYIGATAAGAMMVTMALSFVVFQVILNPMTSAWGLVGLWSAVLVFMGARGLLQAAWYPRLLSRLD